MIVSLNVVSIKVEEVGKYWLCLLRLWNNSFLCFYLLIDNILENLRVVDKVLLSSYNEFSDIASLICMFALKRCLCSLVSY